MKKRHNIDKVFNDILKIQDKNTITKTKSYNAPVFTYPLKFIKHITGINNLSELTNRENITKLFWNYKYTNENGIEFPIKYFIQYGGRAAGKTESNARFILTMSYQYPDMNILCLRAVKSGTNASMVQTFQVLIQQYNLPFQVVGSQGKIYPLIKVDGKYIRTRGYIYITGLEGKNSHNIKGMSNVSFCWVDEAQYITREPADLMIKSIRGGKSRYRDLKGNITKEYKETPIKFIFSFNPRSQHDWVYDTYIVNKVNSASVCKYSFNEDVRFMLPSDHHLTTEYLENKKRAKIDKDYRNEFLHTWEGEIKRISNSQVLYHKLKIFDFKTPPINRGLYYNERARVPCWLFGADWGFKIDPCCVVKCFMMLEQGAYAPDLFIDKVCFIDKEGHFENIRDKVTQAIPELNNGWYDRNYNLFSFYGDNAPANYVANLRQLGCQDAKRNGGNIFNIWQHLQQVEKPQDSVLKGIHYLTYGIRHIVVRPYKIKGDNNYRLIEEFERYEYKIKSNGDVITYENPVDKYNHGIDAIRYAVSSYINKGIRDHSRDKIPFYDKTQYPLYENTETEIDKTKAETILKLYTNTKS